MSNFKYRKGYSLTLVAVVAAIIAAAFVPAFCNVMFFSGRTSTTGLLAQTGYYNACSGVEYAMFIIEHSATYSPFNPDGTTSGKAAWPKGNNSQTSNTFQCLADPSQGTATVTITDGGLGSFNVNSLGTMGKVTATINAHINAGKIESWQ